MYWAPTVCQLTGVVGILVKMYPRAEGVCLCNGDSLSEQNVTI